MCAFAERLHRPGVVPRQGTRVLPLLQFRHSYHFGAGGFGDFSLHVFIVVYNGAVGHSETGLVVVLGCLYVAGSSGVPSLLL